VLRRQRGGPAAARNTGIVEARGAFLALLDQDDLWVPDKLALQLAAFQDDPSLDVCVGHIQSFRDEPPPDAGMRNVGEPVAGYITTTMLARRTAFDRVGLLDPVLEHGDSADWFLRADELGVSVRLLTDVLILHRLHDANHSLTHGDASRREFLRLAKARVDRLRGRATSGQDL